VEPRAAVPGANGVVPQEDSIIRAAQEQEITSEDVTLTVDADHSLQLRNCVGKLCMQPPPT
jgi:uncharacterized alpha/beta hydrolase family protein